MKTRLIGMENAKAAIEEVCLHAETYRNRQLPLVFVCHLDPGCGRTNLLRYAALNLKKSRVRSFMCLDDWIELEELNGSIDDLNKNFEYVRSMAVYDNNYTGVIGISLENIASYVSQKLLIDKFLRYIEINSRKSCIILFTSACDERNELSLVEKVRRKIGIIHDIPRDNITDCDLMDFFLSRTILAEDTKLGEFQKFSDETVARIKEAVYPASYRNCAILIDIIMSGVKHYTEKGMPIISDDVILEGIEKLESFKEDINNAYYQRRTV